MIKPVRCITILPLVIGCISCSSGTKNPSTQQMSKYTVCITDENNKHKELAIEAIKSGKDLDLNIPRSAYEKCRKQEGIADSVQLYNALKKCASKQDALDKDTSLNAQTCSLILKFGSHSKLI
jgi:hypothetical protein